MRPRRPFKAFERIQLTSDMVSVLAHQYVKSLDKKVFS